MPGGAVSRVFMSKPDDKCKTPVARQAIALRGRFMIGLSKSRAQSRHRPAVGRCYRCACSAAILTVPCAARNLFGNDCHKPPTKGFEGEVLFETSSRRAAHARQIGLMLESPKQFRR
jgi:hypothetical protein